MTSTGIDHHHIPWCSVDQIEQCLVPKKPFIFNTDLHTGQGIHWISAVLLEQLFQKEREGSGGTLFPQRVLYIYDSLGKKNQRNNSQILLNTLRQHQIKPYFYDNPSQNDQSTWCGYYAIVSAQKMEQTLQQNPHASMTDINHAIDSLYGRDHKPTLQDELTVLYHYLPAQSLTKLFKKGEGYGGNEVPQEVEGAGFFDFLNDVGRRVKGIYYALKGTRPNFQPAMRKILQQVGDLPITQMSVGRRVLGQVFSKVLTVVNNVSGTVPNLPPDQLFHLYLILSLENGSVWRLEKNQSLNLIPYTPDQGEELISLSIPQGLTINTLLNKTIQQFGQEAVFHYNAFSNNCQMFVMNLLESNQIPLSSSLSQWIQQPVQNLVPHWAQKLAQWGTDLANRGEMILQGYGGTTTFSHHPFLSVKHYL